MHKTMYRKLVQFCAYVNSEDMLLSELRKQNERKVFYIMEIRKSKKLMAYLLAFLMVASAMSPLFVKETFAASAKTLSITEAAGWLETAYAEWTPVDGAAGYMAYVKKASESDAAFVQLDSELIRQYAGYWRADAPGLAAGSYVMNIVAVMKDGSRISCKTGTLDVKAHDRSGFAFSSKSKYGTGSGAYNDDGTLKSNAQVVYVTADTAKTCKAVVGGKEITGFQSILDAKQKDTTGTPIDFRIIGRVSLNDLDHISSSAEGIQIKGKSAYAQMNITVEGIGEDAAVHGFGFLVRNAGNVEFRNFALMAFMDDGISLDTKNCNIWVHNMDIFYGSTGGDSDQAKGDGSVDVKGASTNVTISYVHFWDSGKCSLCGMSDSAEFLVTYHHNWFDHSDSRHARIRVASVHLYNNYYDGNAKYGVGTTKGSSAFVEANYFRNCKNPMMSSLQGSDARADKGTFSGENGGMIKAYGNVVEGASNLVYANSDAGTMSADPKSFDAYLASSRDEQVPSSYTTVAGGTKYNNFDTSSSYDIGVKASAVDKAEDVPAVVTKYAGRMNGGDFKWTFSASDDTNYSVDTALKSAVVSYKSSARAIGGYNGKAEIPAETTTQAPTVKPTEKATEKATQAPTVKPTEKATEKATEKETQAPTVKPTEKETQSLAPSVTETKIHNFTKNGKTSSYFKITGNLSKSKGKVTYNGLKLTKCLKIESSTKITFKTDSDAKLTLVFNASNSSAIKVDGREYALDNGILNIEIKAGEHSITKADPANLFYIEVSSKKSSSEETTTEKASESTTQAPTEKPSDSRPETPVESDIYVSPSGKASAAGSKNDPMDFVTAINKISAGKTIYMAEGTYKYTQTILINENNSGKEGAYKTVKALGGKKVTIDFDGMAEAGANRGIVLDGSYWHFYGIDICNAGDNGMLLSGDHNILELCQFYANHDSGLQISRYNTSYNTIDKWPSYNRILNCTAFNNKDEATAENADGFAAKLTCGEGNVFDGCISYCNSDDGWDLYAKPATGSIGVITIRNCVAFGNGKLTDGTGSANGDMNGFKLGGSNGACPTPHIVENCLAFNNGATGFTDNGNGGAISMKNCTAVNNGVFNSAKANFMCYRTSSGAKYTNLVSYMADSRTGATDQFLGTVTNSIYNYKGVGTYWVNSWKATGGKTKYTGSEANDHKITSSDFVSTTIPGYNASKGSYATDYHTTLRNADGSINMNGLFQLRSSSDIARTGAGAGL